MDAGRNLSDVASSYPLTRKAVKARMKARAGRKEKKAP
jgi:hypothetical protein